jgi:hypothetical protein
LPEPVGKVVMPFAIIELKRSLEVKMGLNEVAAKEMGDAKNAVSD